MNVLDYLINDLNQDTVAKDKDGLTTVHAATQNERASTVKVRGDGVYVRVQLTSVEPFP